MRSASRLAERLVHDEQAGLRQQRPPDGDPLPLAARERVRPPFSNRAEAEQVHDAATPNGPRGRPAQPVAQIAAARRDAGTAARPGTRPRSAAVRAAERRRTRYRRAPRRPRRPGTRTAAAVPASTAAIVDLPRRSGRTGRVVPGVGASSATSKVVPGKAWRNATSRLTAAGRLAAQSPSRPASTAEA